MTRLTRRAFATIAVSLCLTAVAGAGCGKKGDDIPVGAFLSLTGGDSTFGIDTKDGIELAVDQVNAAGGIKGKKVRVIYEDDKTESREATLKVQQLIDRENVVAILGEVASSRSLAGGIIANTKKVPMVTPSSTAVEVTKGREYVFRTCFTDAQQGNVAAHFVKENLKKDKVALLFAAQDPYSSGLAQSFKEVFEKLGGQIVESKSFQDKETNFRTYLEGIKTKSPDIVFAPVYYSEMVTIARQAKEIGIPGSTFVGGDGWDSTTLLSGAGGELEGAYFTNHYAPDISWEASKAFVAAFKAKHQKAPNGLSAQGYDAAKVLFDAMARASELKPEAIKLALAETKGFPGATGNITIDKDHNADKAVIMVQVKNKAFTFASEHTAK